MEMKDYHNEDSGWKNVMFPTEPASAKSCPACRTPIRYVRRYGRIIKKCMQNKKFLLKHDSQLKKIAKQTISLEKEMKNKRNKSEHGLRKFESKHIYY